MLATADDLDAFLQDYRAGAAPAKQALGKDDLDEFLKSYAVDSSKPTASDLKTPIPFAPPAPRQSPTEATTKVGQPLTTLTPPPADTSTTPVNVFSGQAQAPGMRTEEETKQLGTIGPASGHTVEETARRVVPRAFRDQPVTAADNNAINLEGFMTPVEQEKHPYVTGAAQAVSGLTSPENVGLLAATGGIGAVPGAIGKLAKVGISTLFGSQMLKGAYDSIPGIKAARDRGDWNEVKRLATLAGINTAMGAAALGHAGLETFTDKFPGRPGAPAEGAAATEGEPPTGAPPVPGKWEPLVPKSAARATPPVAPDVNALLSAARPEQPKTPPNAVRTPSEPTSKGPVSTSSFPEGHIGPKQEPLAPEKPETLKAQVKALADGTNKVVYIPKGTETVPAPPENAKVTVVPGDKPGAGTYYHTADVKPSMIEGAVNEGTFGKLLGNTQGKSEAIAGGKPTAVIARDESGNEVKSALADSTNPQAVAEQAAVLARQFPNAKIGIEPPEKVVNDRLGVPREPPSAKPFSQSTREVRPDGSATTTGAPDSAREIFALEKELVDSGKLKQEDIPALRRMVTDAREKNGTPGLHEDTYRALLRRVTSVPAEQDTSRQNVPLKQNTLQAERRTNTEQRVALAGSPIESRIKQLRAQLRDPSLTGRDREIMQSQLDTAIAHPEDFSEADVSRRVQDMKVEQKLTHEEALANQEKRKAGVSDAKSAVSGRESQLLGKAKQVRGIDPALADELTGLAQGKFTDPQHFQEFVKEHVHDPETSSAFAKAFKDYETQTTAKGNNVASEAAQNKKPGNVREPSSIEKPEAGALEPLPNVREPLRGQHAGARGPENPIGDESELDRFIREHRETNRLKVGDRVAAQEGPLKGKTLEVTRVGETGIYAREGEGPIKFLKNGDFEAAPKHEAKVAPEVQGMLQESELKSYSGLDPALIKFLIPEKLREKIGEEATKVKQSRDLQAGFYELDSQAAADMLRARKVLKNAPGKPADLENIYHHIEDPSIKLTPEQQSIMASYVKPILDAAGEAYRKVSEGAEPAENHVHRIAIDKGHMLDRILGGEGKLSAGNTLSKSASGTKSRTMMALVDADGKRQVVSIKGGTVTAWNDGKATELGKIRGLATQGLKSQGDIIEREIAPLKKELDKLEAERRVLTSSKGREGLSKVRIGNIENRQAELREAMQDAYRKNDGQLVSEADLKDRKFLDRNGKQWKITDATTKEIEGNTNLKYYKNALASSVVDYLQMRRAERAFDFLESYKNSEDFAQVAAKTNGKNVPAGWHSTDLPQFHGYVFEPHTAEVLDWYAKRLKVEGPSVYDKIGNFLRTAIFFNPLMHTKNIAAHWATEKGLTNLLPQNWLRIARTGARAIDAVIHQNKDFLDALDQGSPLQSQRLDNDATTKLLVERMGKELEANHPYAAKIASALGYINPAKMIREIYKFSSKATWLTDDIARLQATYERMERKGEDFKTAMTEVSKHLPDYRLPTRIFDSKSLGYVMSNPKLTMFGAYHYGMLKSFGDTARALVDDSLPTSERMDALNRIGALALINFVVYPALDELAKKLSGDKTAQFMRSGPYKFIDDIVKLAHGERTPTDTIQSIVTPAVGLKSSVELAVNRNIRTGRKIYDPSAPPETIGKQLGRYAGHAISPIDQAMQVTGGRKTVPQQIAAQFGIKTNVPSPAVALARRFNSDKSGSEVPDEDTLERAIMRGKYEDQLRNDSMTIDQLQEAQADGKITAKDRQIILRNAARTPLQNAFRNLNPVQALKVWDKATPDEQDEVRHLLSNKLSGIKNLPEDQREKIRDRITDALHPTDKAPPRSMGIPLTPPGLNQ